MTHRWVIYFRWVIRMLGIVISLISVSSWLLFTLRVYCNVENTEYANYEIGKTTNSPELATRSSLVLLIISHNLWLILILIFLITNRRHISSVNEEINSNDSLFLHSPNSDVLELPTARTTVAICGTLSQSKENHSDRFDIEQDLSSKF